MKFFGKYYIGYLFFAFIVGTVWTIIAKEFALWNFMIFTIFVWAGLVVVERLVDDYRHLGREFFVGFDVLELFIMIVMATIMFVNFLNTLNGGGSSSSLLFLLMITFTFFIVFSTVRSNLLRAMVRFEWDSKLNLVKSTVDKAMNNEEIDVDTASMVSKILVKKFDWSLRSTAKAVGKSHITVKRYLERKDSKLVD